MKGCLWHQPRERLKRQLGGLLWKTIEKSSAESTLLTDLQHCCPLLEYGQSKDVNLRILSIKGSMDGRTKGGKLGGQI